MGLADEHVRAAERVAQVQPRVSRILGCDRICLLSVYNAAGTPSPGAIYPHALRR